MVGAGFAAARGGERHRLRFAKRERLQALGKLRNGFERYRRRHDAHARIPDFLLDAEDHIFCLEANTLPGMTPTSLLPQEAKVTGVDFNQLCEKLIESSMRKYKN